MKLKIRLVIVSLLSSSSVFAAGIYTETGYSGFANSCSGDQYTDCEAAEMAAQSLALEDCHAAGNKTCIVTDCHDTDWGGGCTLNQDAGYCTAEATVTGK